jgi:DNA-binding FrmR family transcriptional regulator
MAHYPSHHDELMRLKKIEGQVRGLGRMIQQGRYCVDILQVMSSIQGALGKVENQILKRHLEGCVTHAVRSGSPKQRTEKFQEIMDLIAKFRK